MTIHPHGASLAVSTSPAACTRVLSSPGAEPEPTTLTLGALSGVSNGRLVLFSAVKGGRKSDLSVCLHEETIDVVSAFEAEWFLLFGTP